MDEKVYIEVDVNAMNSEWYHSSERRGSATMKFVIPRSTIWGLDIGNAIIGLIQAACLEMTMKEEDEEAEDG